MGHRVKKTTTKTPSGVGLLDSLRLSKCRGGVRSFGVLQPLPKAVTPSHHQITPSLLQSDNSFPPADHLMLICLRMRERKTTSWMRRGGLDSSWRWAWHCTQQADMLVTFQLCNRYACSFPSGWEHNPLAVLTGRARQRHPWEQRSHCAMVRW